MKSKYTIRKYDGDHSNSWAVFYSRDVVGTRGIVFYGDAQPIASGCSRRQAQSIKKTLEAYEAN